MRSGISPGRLAYEAGTTLTEAECWRIVRKDGRVFNLTTADISLVLDSEIYSPLAATKTSAIVSTAGLAVDNLNVQFFLDSDAFTEADVMAGRWDDAKFTIVSLNPLNPLQGRTIEAAGTIGTMGTGRITGSFELRSLSQRYSQNVGRTVMIKCDCNVFDDRCKEDPLLYIVSGSVTAVTDGKHFSSSMRTEMDTWFDFGWVDWITSANGNAGLGQEISTQVGSDFALQLRMPFPIAVGDTYTMLPGCNHLLKAEGDADGLPYTGHCRSKYTRTNPGGNAANFRGHCQVPGLNRTMGEGNAS